MLFKPTLFRPGPECPNNGPERLPFMPTYFRPIKLIGGADAVADYFFQTRSDSAETVLKDLVIIIAAIHWTDLRSFTLVFLLRAVDQIAHPLVIIGSIVVESKNRSRFSIMATVQSEAVVYIQSTRHKAWLPDICF